MSDDVVVDLGELGLIVPEEKQAYQDFDSAFKWYCGPDDLADFIRVGELLEKLKHNAPSKPESAHLEQIFEALMDGAFCSPFDWSNEEWQGVVFQVQAPSGEFGVGRRALIKVRLKETLLFSLSRYGAYDSDPAVKKYIGENRPADIDALVDYWAENQTAVGDDHHWRTSYELDLQELEKCEEEHLAFIDEFPNFPQGLETPKGTLLTPENSPYRKAVDEMGKHPHREIIEIVRPWISDLRGENRQRFLSEVWVNSVAANQWMENIYPSNLTRNNKTHLIDDVSFQIKVEDTYEYCENVQSWFATVKNDIANTAKISGQHTLLINSLIGAEFSEQLRPFFHFVRNNSSLKTEKQDWLIAYVWLYNYLSALGIKDVKSGKDVTIDVFDEDLTGFVSKYLTDEDPKDSVNFLLKDMGVAPIKTFFFSKEFIGNTKAAISEGSLKKARSTTQDKGKNWSAVQLTFQNFISYLKMI